MSDEKSSPSSGKEKHQQRWHRMVVFGDSLSVSPNRFDEDFPPHPDVKRRTHFGQRFSNGWTMVEYLRDSLNIPTNRFHNFATGGETSDDMRMTQFPMFLDLKFDMQLGQDSDQAELFVVFGGSNDFAPFLMRLGTDPMKGVKEFLFGKLSKEMEATMDETVERIVHIMDNLYHCASARYYFVPNIPNVVSDLPFTKKVFNKYHDKLKKAIKKFQKKYPEATVVIWDLSAVITDMQSHPNKFELTQVSLFKNHEKTQSPPEQTLFWDGAGHFTTKAHGELAKNALKYLQKATPKVEIPERPEPVEEKEWTCMKCSYSNRPRRRRCEICGFSKNNPANQMGVAFADLPQYHLEVMSKEWACERCTYNNLPMTSKCEVCDARPSQEQLNCNSKNSQKDDSISSQDENSEKPQSSPQDSSNSDDIPVAENSGGGGGGKPPVANGHIPISEWDCQICTFRNGARVVKCEMCLAPHQAVVSS